MSLSVGIVGLPNVGKSTLFNALLSRQVAQASNYPFTTIEPNIGVVEVPEERLLKLRQVVEKSEGLNPGFKIIPAAIQFVDIAGLVSGAHKGEGLGNQFLSHIREVDVIIFVLRGFKNEDIVRSGSVDPGQDLEVLKVELLLKDLETIEKRIDSLKKELKLAGPSDPRHKVLATLLKSQILVKEEKWLSENLDEEDLENILGLSLLSAKKTIYVENCDEVDLEKPPTIQGAIRVCAKIEEEISQLPEVEKEEYLEELRLGQSGLEKLIKKSYETLGLITFFTAGPKEVRAWTVKKGTLAPQAAGVIHTDFERGFIAADVLPCADLVAIGSWQKARETGKIQTVSRSYQVLDGDVVEFKFGV